MAAKQRCKYVSIYVYLLLSYVDISVSLQQSFECSILFKEFSVLEDP